MRKQFHTGDPTPPPHSIIQEVKKTKRFTMSIFSAQGQSVDGKITM